MRKILLSFFAVLVFLSTAFTQTRTITGKITDSTGGPVPFASVKQKGTKLAVIADNTGSFQIKAKNGDVFQISSTGYVTQELTIGSEDFYNVVLKMGTLSTLTDVVVTGAYNSKRLGRSVSYNAQVVTGEEMNTIRQTNLNAALAGKVSGMQFRGQSILKLGNTGGVQLGGFNGLSGSSPAIYVVDGTILPDVDNLNLDDVESVTVLQGPAATAQFGSQGANGAIVITTKVGTHQKGLGVDVNLGTQFDKVYVLPHYQNSYSGGSSQDMTLYTWQEGQPEEWKALSGKYYHNYEDDASWGPRMVGQEYIPWYAWYNGTKYSFTTAKLTPQPNNAREFYNTGITYNNTISVNSSSEKTNFRLSYGNIYVQGIIPYSSLSKNTLNLNLQHNLNQHLSITANINYTDRIIKGQIDEDGYANATSGSFNQWFHRELDFGIMKELKDLKTPEGIYASWNHNNPGSYDAANPLSFYGGNYWYNPYVNLRERPRTQRNDRLYGNISLIYKITNDLTLRATYRKQQNTYYGESQTSSDLANSATQTGVKGYYFTYQLFLNRENYEAAASYSKQIHDFNIDATIGSDFYRMVSKVNTSNTNNGLVVPNFYAISNSVDAPTVNNYRSREAYNALYGIASVGYKNFVFLDATLRNDWYSTLPENNNNVLSKSFGGTFVFHELIHVPVINYAKLRLSWGEIPQALGYPYDPTSFGAYRYPGLAYGINPNQWAGHIMTSTPGIVVDSSIHGAVSTRKEIGLEMRFFKSRLGFNATYWEGTQKDFPYQLSVNGVSGFSFLLTNIGEVKQQSLELQLNARPVWIQNKFEWQFNATWARLFKNDVVKLAEGVKQSGYVEATAFYTSTPNISQFEGERAFQLWGNGIKMLNGKRVINSAGDGYVSDVTKKFGSVIPLYTGGVQNSFEIFKDFVVNVNIDYQYGGKFFSLSDMWGGYSGLTARTATYNDKGNPIRDPVADGGGYHMVGVDEDGKDVDYYVNAQTYFHNLLNNLTMDDYVYDLTFIKLREVSIGYYLPVEKMGLGKIVNNAVFSIVARNPLLIYAQTKDFDPSELSGLGTENGQYPGTRGFGFNLKVSF